MVQFHPTTAGLTIGQIPDPCPTHPITPLPAHFLLDLPLYHILRRAHPQDGNPKVTSPRTDYLPRKHINPTRGNRFHLRRPGVIGLESATLRVSREKVALTMEIGRSERERENVRRDGELWEKGREDRVPQGAFWEAVWPAWDCRAYGKREYWGTLRNIPEN